MNDDFETMLKTRLNAQIDAELGRREPAPPFVPGDAAAPSRRRPWVLPLLAAACVIVVAGGSAGAAHLLGEKHKSVRAGTIAPTPSAAPTGSAHPLPIQSTAAVPPNVPSPAGSHQIRLGGASISLPAGWEARALQRYYEGGGSLIYRQAWCLTPASRPIVRYTAAHTDNCPVAFGTVDPGGNALDVDIVGGYAADPHPCGQQTRPADSEQYGVRTLGGRTADWRRFRYDCPSGVKRFEQYVVATGPAFVLYSHLADAATHEAMAEIAAGSALPSAGAGLRLMDRGYLRTVTSAGNQVRVTLDRVVETDDAKIHNSDPATYEYTIPAAEFDGADPRVTIGDLVYLQTNGSKVLLFARQP